MASATNTVVRGTNDKPVASDLLAEYFESPDAISGGQLFIGYPITTMTEGRRPIDAVYVHPAAGVVVFDLVEGAQLGDFQDRQDDAANRLEIRLKAHRPLVQNRALRIAIHTVTFAPAAGAPAVQDSQGPYTVSTSETLDSALRGLTWEGADLDVYHRTVSALQSITGIRDPGRSRHVASATSRGAILKRLENSISTLDHRQSKAVVETAADVQRIRGLAGSGKTVVLALKAAYLHAQHEDWRIAVTFNTRSLREQFTRLINTFTIEQTGEEPDWSRLHIMQAWGAPGAGNREGIYHRFCVENGAAYRDFGAAKNRYGTADAFSGVCRDALGEVPHPAHLYDAILVDEAQDLPPEFLQLCYKMLGVDKRLVYAYDELQTLNGAGLPPAETIFGSRDDGTPRVTFDDVSGAGPDRDIILQKCYRNSRPVLVTAHALGFGIYRDPPKGSSTGLVQMFEQTNLWHDIGYGVVEGELVDGHPVTLARDHESSPVFLEDHSPLEDLVQFHAFDSDRAQCEWVADQIEHNLNVDELNYNDIIVINPNPLTTRANVGSLRAALIKRGIASHIAGVDYSTDVFFRTDVDSITITGIHRAKGNEAGMVYILNAEESVSGAANLARIRNRLFTAITRSKAWVRVAGVGAEMTVLQAEYNRVASREYTLNFRYPTEGERAQMQIVHRDMSKADQNRVRKHNQHLSELVADLSAGDAFPEDLDPQALAILRRLLTDEPT